MRRLLVFLILSIAFLMNSCASVNGSALAMHTRAKKTIVLHKGDNFKALMTTPMLHILLKKIWI